MYLVRILLALSTGLSWFNICNVSGLSYFHTHKPLSIKSNTLSSDFVDRYYHKPPYIPQRPPEDTHPYPPPYIPQRPPEETHPYPPPYIPQPPPQDSQQYPTQRPPHKPRPIPPTTIVDKFDSRCYDGSYEYRYELTDGTVRFELGHFINYQGKNILVVKGYYSHRLPDSRYLTVFYTADQNGYRQTSPIFSLHRPILPQSLREDRDSIGNCVQSSKTIYDDQFQ